MSIAQIIIADAVRDGRLHALSPKPKHVPRIRSLYLTDELFKAMTAPALTGEGIQRFAALEATLADFVTSRTLDPEYIKILKPHHDCVWEIRSVLPDPSIRVLGQFAEKDAFVATNYELRNVLGPFDSEQWEWHKTKAKASFKKIFQAHNPRREADAKLLITGAIHDKYLK